MKLSKAQIATLEKVKNKEVKIYFHRNNTSRKFRGARSNTIYSLDEMGLVRIPFVDYNDIAILKLTDAGRAALEEVRK